MQARKSYLYEKMQFYVNDEKVAMGVGRIIECSVSSIMLVTRVETPLQFLAWFNLTVASITGRAAGEYIDRYIFGVKNREDPRVQGAVEDFVRSARTGLINLKHMSENPVFSRIVKAYKFLLVQGFLKKMGLEVNDEEFSKFEQRALLIEYSSKQEFLFHMVESMLFLTEKFFEFRNTGDVSCFMHSETIYSKWSTEADKLLNLAPFTGNLEPHGTSYFQFRSDLMSLIEKGEAYTKYISQSSNVEIVAMKRRLNSLRILKNTEITRKAAQQMRECPFGVLIHGRSGQAKSTFTRILFYHFGKVFGLPIGDDFIYFRNPLEQWWNGFDSSKWCIVLDDIACFRSGALSEVDPSTKEIIFIQNMTPTMPPQASLEDKGKTPILAKLVIATTNTDHLNANDFFECPLAVRRRLPFVVTVEVKPEYRQKDSTFADSEKMNTEPGTYPDFWIITLKRIVPLMEGTRERATLEKVGEWSNIYEFLDVYTMSIKAHAASQFKAVKSNSLVSAVDLCAVCYRPQVACKCDSFTLQAQEFEENVTTNWVLPERQNSRVVRYCKQALVYTVDQIAELVVRALLFLGCLIVRKSKERVLRQVNRFCSENKAIQLAGRVATRVVKPKHFDAYILIGGIMAMCCGSYYYYVKSQEEKPKEKPKQCGLGADDCKCKHWHCDYEECKGECTDMGGIPKHYVPQGNVMNTTEEDLEQSKSENVWYNDSVAITSFDLPSSSLSLSGAKPEKLRDIFHKNLCYISVRTPGVNIKSMCGIFLKGNTCLVPAHIFGNNEGEVEVFLVFQTTSKGINSNISFNLDLSHVYMDRKKDVALFNVYSIPPKKDILKFWCEKDITPSSVHYLYRESSGDCRYRTIRGISDWGFYDVEEISATVHLHTGKCEHESFDGLCGAIALANTPKGIAIIGIHMLGREDIHGYNVIGRAFIERSLSNLSQISPILGGINGGSKPMLEIQDKEITLVEPHFKSLVRYLERGTLNVYGTVAGFHPQPKTKVKKMILCDEFLEYYNVPNNYTAPVMKGWEPWHNNFKEMVEVPTTFDRNILRECAEGYLEDIIVGLPENWEGELVFLSNKAAVNGLPGVQYIDGINRKSSMGFPWNKTKKAFLLDSPDEKYPNGVDFPEEFWERVNKIEDTYKNLERAFAIFMGHLKDEAVSKEKARIKKTRLFTGAPSDWAVVVRKHLLSFVRLVQMNKEVFEACPGAVCQSVEWELFYQHLTQHGVDRMIAGDFSKFDKRMSPEFILWAFWIIVEIFKKAGFSDEEVKIIWGIAYDIAYPMCIIKGDLVEFFGTNPSGHPLTVIINSMVNSLYIRYAYRCSNPEKTVKTFKKNVALLTYGDDNTMGVSSEIQWFDHTVIQDQLSKIGVKYTMADKDAESVPFLNIKDISFLKRKWVWNEEIGHHLAMLDEDSIIKSLTINTPSDSLDEHAHMCAVISSANSEYFFYGREVHDKRREKFLEIMERRPYTFYATTYSLPSWDELKDRYLSASVEIEESRAKRVRGFGRSRTRN
ncbi:hypothetical protein 1 [Changjiang picorna-like virus 4]|uniref:hypothetical protein 1 n=1 Tax=Changjiang picorna-like virus 4 TaxID=1922793 RepID=UPI00090A2C9B|nr:hypothetical protein 1 [Changjiang picorna-like virus 4]APG78994.1 hypothetical protein 1 [Changjiang picorna-like virus 4]